MRGIKFRAYDGQQMRHDITGFEFFDGEMTGIFIDGDFYNKEEIELLQYTGLKDKNGKEIYEGDIVEIHKHSYDYGFKKDEIGQIKFIDGCFGFYREKTKNEYYFNDLATESGYGELDYYEVIGNIYDNPDLLEKASD